MGVIVCFGEVLLRLSSPPGETMLQSAGLDVCVGGAEANVAVSLSILGSPSRMATVLPDNALGRAAAGELARHGVSLEAVRFQTGRMGLYFLTPGAVVRPASVLYDRRGSVFAEAPGAVDWASALKGADWLHLSGVTPALGPAAAEAALTGARAANAAGVKVSFDGNYRASLWSGREAEAPATLRALMGCAELMFADARDVALALGEGPDDPAAAAELAFQAFPRLQRLAATARVQHDVDRHELSARAFTRDGGRWSAPVVSLSGVVDRIGGGDAFAAGLLHGLQRGRADQDALSFALAAAALKHTIRGDFNLAAADAVEDLLAGGGFHVRR